MNNTTEALNQTLSNASQQLNETLNNSTEIPQAVTQDSIKTTTWVADGSDETAVSYLQIACLAAFFISLILFLYLIKKYAFKYLGFFILRKDYQRFHLVDMNNLYNIQSSQQQYQLEEINSLPSKLQDQSQNKHLWRLRFVYRRTMQNLHKYHPLFGIAFTCFHKRIALKHPLHMLFWFFMVCLFSNLSLSVAITLLAQAKCQDKRFYAANSLACSSFDFNEFEMSQQMYLGLISSIIAVFLTMIFIWFFSKNFFQFLMSFSLFRNQQYQEIRETYMRSVGYSASQIENGPEAFSQKNLMENDDQLRSEKIRKENDMVEEDKRNNDKTYSQIGYHETMAGKPSLITLKQYNNNDFIKQKQLGQEQADEEQKQDPNSKIRQLDSKATNLIDSHTQNYTGRNILAGNNSSIQNESLNLQKLQSVESPILQNDFKKTQVDKNIDEDSNQDAQTQIVNFQIDENSRKNKSLLVTFLKVIIGILVASVFVLCLLLDAYSFFNLTFTGLLNTMKIFVLSFLIDFIIVRVLVNLVLSLAQMVYGIIKNNLEIIDHDGDALKALGQLYKVYQAPFNQYEVLKNDSDDDDQHDDENKKQNQTSQNENGIRFIKIQSKNNKNTKKFPQRDIVIVEPTYSMNSLKKGSNLLGKLFSSPKKFYSGQKSKASSSKKQGSLTKQIQDDSISLRQPFNYKRQDESETDLESKHNKFFFKSQNGEYIPINIKKYLFDNPLSVIPEENQKEKENNLFKRNKKGEMVPCTYKQIHDYSQKHFDLNNNQQNKNKLNDDHKGQKTYNINKNAMNKGQFNMNDYSINGLGNSTQTLDIHDYKKKTSREDETMNSLGTRQFKSSYYINNNGNSNLYEVSENSNSKYSGQKQSRYQNSKSPNHNYFQQNSPSDMNETDHNNSPQRIKNKAKQDIIKIQNSYNQKKQDSDQKQQFQIDPKGLPKNSSNKKSHNTNNFLSNLAQQFFKSPIFAQIWSKKGKKESQISPFKNNKKTLQQILQVDKSKNVNLPLIMQDSNIDNFLSNNYGFKQIKKGNNNSILFAEAKSIYDLPIVMNNPNNYEEHKSVDINSKQQKSGEKMKVSNKPQHFNAQEYQQKQELKDQNFDLTKLLLQQMKFKKKNGEICEITNQDIYNLPFFTKDGKMVKEMKNIQQLILKEFEKKRQKGEEIKIDSTSLFELEGIMKKNNMNTTKIYELASKLMKKKSKQASEIVGVDQSKVYALSLLYGSDDNLSPYMKDKREEMISWKRSAERVKIQGSKMYDLTQIMNENSEQYNDIKETFQHIQSKSKQGEIIQIDSTQFFEAGGRQSPEMEELQKLLLPLIKKGRLGEICEIDSTQFFNLPIFNRDEAQLSQEMRTLKNYLMLQTIYNKINPGEIIKVCSSYHYHLPDLVVKLQDGQLEYDTTNAREMILQAQKKKRKSNFQNRIAVSGQINFNAGDPRQVLEMQKKLQVEKENSQKLPPITQKFETPRKNIQTLKIDEILMRNESKVVYNGNENFDSIRKYINEENKEQNNELELRLHEQDQESSNSVSSGENDRHAAERNLNNLLLGDGLKNNQSYSPQYSSRAKTKREEFIKSNQKNRYTMNVIDKEELKFKEEINDHRYQQNAQLVQEDLNNPQIYRSGANKSGVLTSNYQTTQEKNKNLENFIKPQLINKQKIKKRIHDYQNSSNNKTDNQNLTFNSQDQSYQADNSNILGNSIKQIKRSLKKDKIDEYIDENDENSQIKANSNYNSQPVSQLSKNQDTQKQKEEQTLQDQRVNFYSPTKEELEEEQKNQIGELDNYTNENEKDVIVLDNDEMSLFTDESNQLSNRMNQKVLGGLTNQNINNQILRDAEIDVKTSKLKFSKRQENNLMLKKNKKNEVRNSSKESSQSQQSSRSIKSNKVVPNIKSNQSNSLYRVQEQKILLNRFLKSAQEIKSQKDIEKIQELINYLNQKQKPLPKQKIDELKALELMASPYNQDLLLQFRQGNNLIKKKNKNNKNNSMNRNSSSNSGRQRVVDINSDHSFGSQGNKMNKNMRFMNNQVQNSSFDGQLSSIKKQGNDDVIKVGLYQNDAIELENFSSESDYNPQVTGIGRFNQKKNQILIEDSQDLND